MATSLIQDTANNLDIGMLPLVGGFLGGLIKGITKPFEKILSGRFSIGDILGAAGAFIDPSGGLSGMNINNFSLGSLARNAGISEASWKKIAAGDTMEIMKVGTLMGAMNQAGEQDRERMKLLKQLSKYAGRQGDFVQETMDIADDYTNNPDKYDQELFNRVTNASAEMMNLGLGNQAGAFSRDYSGDTVHRDAMAYEANRHNSKYKLWMGQYLADRVPRMMAMRSAAAGQGAGYAATTLKIADELQPDTTGIMKGAADWYGKEPMGGPIINAGPGGVNPGGTTGTNGDYRIEDISENWREGNPPPRDLTGTSPTRDEQYSDLYNGSSFTMDVKLDRYGRPIRNRGIDQKYGVAR